MCLLMDTEQGPGHPLVEQHGQKRHGNALDQIQRCDADQHKGGHIADIAVDLGTQGNDGIQGHTVKLCELRQQIDSIESTAENRHAHTAHD